MPSVTNICSMLWVIVQWSLAVPLDAAFSTMSDFKKREEQLWQQQLTATFALCWLWLAGILLWLTWSCWILISVGKSEAQLLDIGIDDCSGNSFARAQEPV